MTGLCGVVRALLARRELNQEGIDSKSRVAGRLRRRWKERVDAQLMQPADVVERHARAPKWDTVLPPFAFAKTVPGAGRAHTGDLGQKRKILIVEDNYLLAELVCNLVRDCGFEPIGPAARLQEACQLAEEGAFDGALLDLKLGHDFCFPIAALLRSRKIPFVFVTGWCESSLIPAEFREVALLPKPFENDEVRAALASIQYELDQRLPLAAAAQASAADSPVALG